MLAGKRVVYYGDSTAFVGYDNGDSVPLASESFCHLIQANNNITMHCIASPAMKANFMVASHLVLGLRGNASAIQRFIRGTGIDWSVYCIGNNDFNLDPVGIIQYIQSMRSTIKSDVAIGTAKIQVCRPFREYYAGGEPTNALGETLTQYGTALSALVTELSALYPTTDIRYTDTSTWIPNDQSYYLADAKHIRANAHALVSAAFVSAWASYGWL
jgi:hypothetical protein